MKKEEYQVMIAHMAACMYPSRRLTPIECVCAAKEIARLSGIEEPRN